jgi:hypothetical protein
VLTVCLECAGEHVLLHQNELADTNSTTRDNDDLLSSLLQERDLFDNISHPGQGDVAVILGDDYKHDRDEL